MMTRNRFWNCGRPVLGVLAISVLAFGFHSQAANAADKPVKGKTLVSMATVDTTYADMTTLVPAGERKGAQIEWGADQSGGGPRGTTACAAMTYDNGTYNLTNGTRPTVGWTDAGAIDDFETTTGVDFSCVQVAMMDNTGGSALQTMRVQIFDLTNIDGAGGGDGTLGGMGSYAAAVNVCDNTYSVGAGTLSLTDTGVDAFGHDVLLLDGTGAKCTLPPGDYGFHLTFPGTAAVDFWATAALAGVSPDCVHIWGTAVDAPGSADCVGGPEFLYMDFKLYQGLGTCGDGTCNPGEDNSNCPQDCYCGNGACDPDEDCSTCTQDCGVCPFCGDGNCDPGEDNSNCSQDCYCGNGACEDDEDCLTCAADCGACPAHCDICYTNCLGGETDCSSTHVTPDDWITNVTFAGINNTTDSEPCPCSYTDYTGGQMANVAPGSTYSLSVSFCSEATWTQYVIAWIDWDQDGVFEATERYDLGSGVDATLTLDIPVPIDAAAGCTVMRVTERYSAASADPCETYTYGEAEDYNVCLGPPDVCGDTTCGPTEDCCSCPDDCGACTCGAGGDCDPCEDCLTCPDDCGVCPAGACCDDITPNCVDDVLEINCTGRFAQDTLCADLTPLCGEVIPTVSEWGLIVMGLLVVSAGVVIVRRRMATQASA